MVSVLYFLKSNTTKIINQLLRPFVLLLTNIVKTHLEHDVASNHIVSIGLADLSFLYRKSLFQVFLRCEDGIDYIFVLNMSVFQRPCGDNILSWYRELVSSLYLHIQRLRSNVDAHLCLWLCFWSPLTPEQDIWQYWVTMLVIWTLTSNVSLLTCVEEGIIRQRHAIGCVETNSFGIANTFKMTDS